MSAEETLNLKQGFESSNRTEADLLARLEQAFALRHDPQHRGYRAATEILDQASSGAFPHAAAVASLVIVYSEAADEAPESVLKRLEEAFEVLETVDDPINLLRASDMLATIKEGSGDYPEALRYAERSLELSRRVGDRLFEGYALSSLAGVFTATGEYELALEKGLLALNIAGEIDSARLESRLRLRVGSTYRRAGARPEARQMLERAYDVARAAENAFTEAAVKVELAQLHEDEGDIERARDCLEEAQQVSRDDVWVIMGPRILLGFCRVYLRLGNLEAVETAYERLESVARGYDLIPVVAEAAALRAEALEKRGLTDRALAALRTHIALREETRESEARKAVKRFQVKAAVAAAEQDAELHRLRYVELEAMQAQLLESERMAAVGGLAASLVQEMNAPLDILQARLDDSVRAVEQLEDALGTEGPKRTQRLLRALGSAHGTSRSAIERLDNWLGSLRQLTRLNKAERRTFDVVEILAGAVALARSRTPPGIDVEAEFSRVPALAGWPDQLNQAFLTLLMNAVEALNERGRIRVAVYEEENSVVVTISDNGPGIPKELQARMFDLSFNSEGSRTRFRVGLATVRAIVHHHDGQIDFDTSAETGTVFTLRLPVRP